MSHLIYAVPSIRLNILPLIMFNCDVEWDNVAHISVVGLLWLDKCLMASFCFSTRADKYQTSWLWALTSSACWRCIWERTDTCSQCALSSSMMSASCLSFPYRLVTWLVWSDYCVGSSCNLLISAAIYLHTAWVQQMFCFRLSSILLADRDWSILYWVVILPIHLKTIFYKIIQVANY